MRALLSRVDPTLDKLGGDTRTLLIRSIVASSSPLDYWVPRFASEGEALAVAADYLRSGMVFRQRRGLEVVRWIPQPVEAADRLLIEVMLGYDVHHALFKRAVDVSCERDDARAVRALQQEPLPASRAASGPAAEPGVAASTGLVRFHANAAVARARNNPRIGPKILDAVRPRHRLTARLLSVYTLVADHFQAFVLVIAWVAVLSQFGAFLIPDDGGLPGSMLSVFKMVTLGVFTMYAELRAATDRRRQKRVVLVGLLAAAFSELSLLRGESANGSDFLGAVLATAPALVFLGYVFVGEAARPFDTDVDRLNNTLFRDIWRVTYRVVLAVAAASLFLVLAGGLSASGTGRTKLSNVDSLKVLLGVLLFFKDAAIATMGALGYKAAITMAFGGRAPEQWLEARD